MSKELKRDWLPKLQARYARRHREGKSRMLDELCEDYQYERKYAIKLLSGGLAPPAGRAHPGPERRYGEIQPVVQYIWLQAEQPCGKRLVPILRQWLPYYERRFERLSREHRKLLGQISAATLDRLLAPARAEQVERGRGGTKPGSLLRSEIPIRTGTWDLSQPGYLEADSVAHCGTSLIGDFIWSLTYTDILSGWTEGGAVWNKGAAGVLAATREVEARLPFALLGFDSDNGGEFLNHHLAVTCGSEKAQWNLLVHGLTTPTTTRMWSKRIGLGRVNSWGTAGWKTRRWWPRSARYIARCGPHGRISFCPV